MAYNTGNAPGSTHPKDLIDNTEDFDFLLTGTGVSHPNRLGVPLKSWKGMEGEHNADQVRREAEFDADQTRRESEHDADQARRESEFDASQAQREDVFGQFLEGSGWTSLGNYASGISIVSHSQTVEYGGQPYALKPSVPASISAPYVTTGNWSAESINFKLVGDNSLRQDLASPEGTGEVGHKRSAIASAVNYANQMLDTLAVSVREFSYLIIDKPNVNDESTWDWSPAVQAAVGFGRKVVYGPGTFTQKSTINYTSGNSFTGENLLTTVVKYAGPAGTWAFNHAFTGNGSDQWPGRVAFSDMTIQGDGTGNLGVGATVNGIRCADDTGTLVNIPYYSLRRVKFDKLKIGVQLEGYGHLFEDAWAEKCLLGYDITHPEQVQMIGCWANYCDIGLDANGRKSKAGHHFIVKGGAFQRCRIGIKLQNLYEPEIDTYFELNTEADLQCGLSADTIYATSVKDLKLRCHSASGPSLANVALYAVVGAQIEYFGFGGVVSAIPHVLTNGYSKYIDVQYNPEGITSTNPWSFLGDSVMRSIARKMGGSQVAQIPTMGTGFTSVAAEPVSYRKLTRDRVAIGGSVSVTTGFANPISNLPLGYRPPTKQTFSCAWYDNAGGSWGTTNAVIEVRTNGDVWWSSGSGNNRTIAFGDIQFSINDGVF